MKDITNGFRRDALLVCDAEAESGDFQLQSAKGTKCELIGVPCKTGAIEGFVVFTNAGYESDRFSLDICLEEHHFPLSDEPPTITIEGESDGGFTAVLSSAKVRAQPRAEIDVPDLLHGKVAFFVTSDPTPWPDD